jgi:hypothetical protein
MVWAGFRNPVRNVITNRNISQTFPRSEKPTPPVTVSSEPVTKQDTSLSEFITTNPQQL